VQSLPRTTHELPDASGRRVEQLGQMVLIASCQSRSQQRDALALRQLVDRGEQLAQLERCLWIGVTRPSLREHASDRLGPPGNDVIARNMPNGSP
jgi:hypothetical protein